MSRPVVRDYTPCLLLTRDEFGRWPYDDELRAEVIAEVVERAAELGRFVLVTSESGLHIDTVRDGKLWPPRSVAAPPPPPAPQPAPGEE